VTGRSGSKPVGIAIVCPAQIDVEAIRTGVEHPDVLRAAGVALAGLQRAVAGLDRRAVLALVGADLAELARMAELPAVVEEFQRRVAGELVRDGALRFRFDTACRDLVEAAAAAERALTTEMVRDKARADDRLVKLRSAGVAEEDIGRLTEAAAPDRAADRARVAALKLEAAQARAFLQDPLRRQELLPSSIAPKV
jgi:hypothetical protein